MPHRDSFIRYQSIVRSAEEMLKQSRSFLALMQQRRSLRAFSDEPVAKKIIENLIQTASTAPSGAHKQPWTFCAVSNPALKKQIRVAAEKEEYESYHGRMSQEWLNDLKPFGTDWQKPFLEIAPWLIVVFRQIYALNEQGEKISHYYVNESVGIACGFLLTAIHQAGLVALTHTPSPMNFLGKLLGRPSYEKPFLLIPVGYPAENAQVPLLERKPIEQISVFFE